MKTPRLPESSPKFNKLVIRSEVLAVIRHLVSMVDPPKQDRLKQLKRLQEMSSPEPVQDILVKELQRCTSPQTLHVIAELLMEFGEIDYLQEKLWNVIRDPSTTDEIKDTANLILRHLGDPSDPDLYLEYLQDPQGLIGRETIRMLEVSSENPEALIDFIDFILSLNTSDQVRLLNSLQRDYPSEYLVNLYIPMLESDPSPELWEQLILNLSETRSPHAAMLLERLSSWPEDRLPVPLKLITKGIKQLQLAGACAPRESVVAAPSEASLSLLKTSDPYQCFVTLSDGIGNQGLLFSRQRSNGDIALVSVALNDLHGIIDCFGFFQLSISDFNKISDKFHEGATKIKVPAEYCAYKLAQAEAINLRKMFRLPYEYRCWQPILEDVVPARPPELDQTFRWVNEDWFAETDNLYQHPDFSSWFLEQGDEPGVTRILQKAILLTEDFLEHPESSLDGYCQQLSEVADMLILQLLQTPWRELLVVRLEEAAYLLDCQNTQTFRNLAATEAHKLKTVTDPKELIEGFPRAFGRRCILEELLRLRTGNPNYESLSQIVETVIAYWES